MPKPIILTFIDTYLPGFKAGGPIRSMANLVDQLGDEFDFRIVTADRDLGDAVPYPDVPVNQWGRAGKASVFYQSPGSEGWQALDASLSEAKYDVIYLNSLFSVQATLRPLLKARFGSLSKVQIVLAPRGELSAGALSLKATKKRVFLTVAKLLGLYRRVTFQASSVHEEADIRREFPNARILIASDLPETGGDLAPRETIGHTLRAVFLSRISPMKNLTGALEMLQRVTAPVALDLYGPKEDAAYWAECEALIGKLPPHVQVRYERPLRPDEVAGTLAGYDFLFLPTLGENYGHVISEALSAGVPALISDRTPWRDLVADNAGADLPLDQPDAFSAWIDDFAKLSHAKREAMRKAAHVRGNDRKKTAADIAANRRLFA